MKDTETKRMALWIALQKKRKMERKTIELVLPLLEHCSERLSCAGCNDYKIENTPENREYARQLDIAEYGEDGTDIKDTDEFIWLSDICVLDYFIKIIKEELKK